MIVSIIFFAVAYLPMGSDDPGTLELSISPYRLNWSSPWSVTGLIAIKTILCPHGAYRAGGGRCIPVAWAKCCEYLSIQRRMKLLLIRRLMHKSAFVLGVGGEIWSYKPTLYLIPSRCSTNVEGRERKREKRKAMCFIWAQLPELKTIKNSANKTVFRRFTWTFCV